MVDKCKLVAMESNPLPSVDGARGIDISSFSRHPWLLRHNWGHPVINFATLSRKESSREAVNMVLTTCGIGFPVFVGSIVFRTYTFWLRPQLIAHSMLNNFTLTDYIHKRKIFYVPFAELLIVFSEIVHISYFSDPLTLPSGTRWPSLRKRRSIEQYWLIWVSAITSVSSRYQ